MNFIDHKLTSKVSREFRRVTQGSTDIVPLDNGDEIRNARWKHKLMKYSANFAMLSTAAQEELTSAFYAADAQLYLFRFRDYGDYVVTDSQLATTAGEQTTVQLTKRYTFGPRVAERMIQAVSTCRVTGPDGPIEGVLDDVLGLFTPDTPWPSGIVTWSGTFDVWVRFGSDEFDMTLRQLDLATADVELLEKRAHR